VKLDVTAAVLLEVAAFLLVFTSRARWTDQAAFYMFGASVLCWASVGGRALRRRLEARR
jgi:hypothetical protein